MQQDVNKFLGGIDQDVHPNQQKEHTSRDVVNFVPVSEDGNLYSITNESGTEIMSNVTFPNGFRVIGYDILNSEIIVVLADGSGNSQVGYIVEDSNPDPTYGFYHPVAPLDPGTGTVPTNNTEFGFSIAHPVDCVSRKLINGHRVLYFTDNNVPYGRVDLNNPPEVGSVADTVKLTFNQSIPTITIDEIVEGVVSTIRPGVTQFITRYVTDTGGVTTFGIPSRPLPMVPSEKADGVSEYSGEFYEFGTINKNIKLTFGNVDTNFSELEVVAIYYEGSESIFKASVVAQLPITSDTINYTYTGPDTENLIELTREELRKINISYTHAKCIEQKDNVLFLSNLRDERSQYNNELQAIANKIRVKYKIEEIQFSGRGDDFETSDLFFTNLGSPYISSLFSVTLVMSEDIDPTTGNDITRYEIQKPGQVASGEIQVLDFSTLLDGDTITIDTSTGGAGLTQPTVVFTARTAPTLPDEFAIGATNDETALNILQAINNSTNVTDYVAVPGATPDVVTLLWSTIDIDANGVSVIYSAAGTTITTTNFANASTTPFTELATAAVVNGNEVTITFTSLVSTNDDLIVFNGGINNTEIPTPENYVTGSSGLGIALDPPNVSSSANNAAGFLDYTDELKTVTSKGYRRDEVYSLAFKILWKDGTTSPGFHIPGFAGYVDDAQFASGVNKFEPGTWPSFSTVNNSSDFVGTYVSQTDYPLGLNYPGDQAGDDNSEQGPGPNTVRKTRHHWMPKLENEPHFKLDGSTEFVRILGLEFEFTQVIPQFILKDVQNIIFIRERRNNSTNKSIYAQGVTNNHMVTADQFNNDGFVVGSNINGGSAQFVNMRNGYYMVENPFFDLSFGVEVDNALAQNGAATWRGMVAPNRTFPGSVVIPGSDDYQNGRTVESDHVRNQVVFHSPESNLLTGFTLNENQIVGFDLEEVLVLDGELSVANFRGDYQFSKIGLFVSDENKIRLYMYMDLFMNYKTFQNSLTGGNNVQVDDARYNSPGVNRIDPLDTTQPGLKVGTKWNQGGLQLLLDDIPVALNGPNARIEILNEYDPKTPGAGYQSTETTEGYVNKAYYVNQAGVKTDLQAGTVSNLLRSLFNLKVTNNSQYGQITNGSFIPIKRFTPTLPNGSFITTYSDVYGGDTFITKYGFNTGQLIPYRPFRRDGFAPINGDQSSNSNRGYAATDGSKANGWDFRTTTYLFVESEINTHFRHRPETEIRQNYFPNEKNLSLLLNAYFPNLGNINAYNTQFSYDDLTRESFVIPSQSSLISNFENRTIYSEEAAEDDTLDSYRSFLVNNYYDLPSETGPIWDTFVEYGVLFMHTPKSLWRTFAEPAATIEGGNIEDAVLGTGRLFARPSREVMDADGGYGGTISQFAGTHTKLGYIFPDLLQGKIFLVALTKGGGSTLQEISKKGLSTFMHKNLDLGTIRFGGQIDLTNVTTLNSHLIDNPFIGIGLAGGYDFKLNRYFLLKFAVENETNGFTLTFSADTNNWFSFHSYKPNVIMAYDNRTLFVRNQDVNGNPITAEFHEMNIGPKGSYFGDVFDSEITFVVVSKNKASAYNNLVINSESVDRTTNIKQKDDNFYELQVYNDRCNTGQYDLIPSNIFGITVGAGQMSIKYRNDEYRIAIPRDSVIDNAADIFDIANLDNTIPIREKIKGNYAVIKLKYDNTADLEFVLNYIKTIFINNFR